MSCLSLALPRLQHRSPAKPHHASENVALAQPPPVGAERGARTLTLRRRYQSEIINLIQGRKGIRHERKPLFYYFEGFGACR